MNRHQYETLLEGLCTCCNLDFKQLRESCILEMEGRTVCLIHDEQVHPQQLSIRIDLGLLDTARHAVREAMLQANYALGLNGAAVFSVEPHSGHAVLTLAQGLEGLTAPRLLDSLKETLQRWNTGWQTLCTAAAVRQDHGPSLTPQPPPDVSQIPLRSKAHS
jgi:hypothetical protein